MRSLSDYYRAAASVAPNSDYSREQLTPGIVHIGVGNFHRAHMARYQELVNRVHPNHGWSITGIGLLPSDQPLLKQLQDQDGLYILVEADQTTENLMPIGAITRLIAAADDARAAIEVMAAEQTRIISTTITEGGYLFDFEQNRFLSKHPSVLEDLNNPKHPKSLFGFLRLALALRKSNDAGPVTLMSCDNVPGNGSVFKAALTAYLQLAGENDLIDWMAAHVSFPNSMVDRITPVTPPDLSARIAALTDNLVDQCPVLAEPFTQWVVEDSFIAGRPLWEDVGVDFVADVEPYERLKIRILNGTHILTAQVGYLMGLRYVHDLMQHPDIHHLAVDYMQQDAAPSISDFDQNTKDRYIQKIIQRFSNPVVQDSVKRVATDGYSRLKNFLMPIVRQQLKASKVSPRMALAFACFLKKLEGKDLAGNPLDVAEPNLSERLRVKFSSNPDTLLKHEKFFGQSNDTATQDFCATVKRLLRDLDHMPLDHIIKQYCS
ncbi:MAG: mannitol dehydrogenase family protein [Saccharospirillum sp.]|nr:mannitol dehydrogenase family protein [Saccharospirillum sp.]